MPSSFDAAFDFMRDHEWVRSDPTGGYTNHPKDRGGETRFGIAKRYHPDVDIASLTLEGAKDIYRREYWNGYGKVNSQAVASKLFDMSVNPGAGAAVRIAQLSCGDCGNPTKVDGGWGPNTLAAINASDPHTLLDAMANHLIDYYQQKLLADPSQAVFINGWKTRARDLPEVAA